MHWLLTYPEDGPSVAFYLRWVKSGGVVPTLLTEDFEHPASLAPFDALLLPGGGDVEPWRYGDPVVHAKTSGQNKDRDELELALIREFITAGKPVFGICRGMQVLNVAFGGRLVQHLPDVLAGGPGEIHSRKDGYDAMHAVRAEPGTRLGGALADVTEVNSSHHQAAHPQYVGRGLRVAARTGAGVIEALECFDERAPIVAVQWHPERLPADNPAATKLLEFMTELSGRGGGT